MIHLQSEFRQSALMLDIKNLYLNQPSREYRLSFDMIADHINNTKRKSLCLCSSAIYVVELLKRCSCKLDIAGTRSFDADEFMSSFDGWVCEGIQTVELDIFPPDYDVIVWVEPGEYQVDLVFHKLRELADNDTKLLVINRGPLMRVLPVWKTKIQPGARLLSQWRLNQILNAAGWQVESVLVFHGPRSIFWSFLLRASTIMKRPDWSDRFIFAMRNTFQEPEWIWWLSTLSLTCARVA